MKKPNELASIEDIMLVAVLNDMPDFLGEPDRDERIMPDGAPPEVWPTILQMRRDIRSGKITAEQIEQAFARVQARFEAETNHK